MDLINVLLFIAKADGMVQAAEIAAIATAAADITGDKNITPGAASAALKMLDTPTLHGFKLAFGRIRKADPNVANKVAQAAHRIVGTQKTIHPAEQAALDYIDKAAGKSG